MEDARERERKREREREREKPLIFFYFLKFLLFQSEQIWTVKEALESLAVKETVKLSEVLTLLCRCVLCSNHCTYSKRAFVVYLLYIALYGNGRRRGAQHTGN